jgi:zinc transport system substrate-binding protein
MRKPITLAKLACRVLAGAILIGPGASAGASELAVVVSSKPAHALVAGVMRGIATPAVLVDGSASPHTYAMKPSDARAVNAATVFFRISESLEPFTGKLVKSLPKSVRVVSLAEAPGLRLLAKRSGGTFESHAGKGHDHGHGQGAKGDHDPHVWLDPGNAKAMVAEIVRVLIAVAPADADKLKANGGDVSARIDALDARLAEDLKPLAGRPFIVLHDAIQYLERRYRLAAAGSITVSPDVQPSAKRLAELRRKVRSLGAVCVFSEPNVDPKVVSAVIEATPARTGMLDPEGTALRPGPEAYEALMSGLAKGLAGCLGGLP